MFENLIYFASDYINHSSNQGYKTQILKKLIPEGLQYIHFFQMTIWNNWFILTSTIEPGGFGQLLSNTVVGKLLDNRSRWDFLTYATN